MNFFPNQASAQRIFYGISKYLNQNWNKPKTKFTQNS
jgi:transposase-like protein